MTRAGEALGAVANKAVCLFLIAGLILTLVLRQAIGLGCCLTQQVSVERGGKPQPKRMCGCCRSLGELAQVDQESEPGPRVPCKAPASPSCIEWCCGAGFVPLTVPLHAVGAYDLSRSSDPVIMRAIPIDGFHPRIEHPPRSCS
jgi:hypothetical protein